jgi:outer membrane protein insertion porin family
MVRMRSLRRVVDFPYACGVVALAVIAPLSLAAETWTETRPADVSLYSLENISFEGDFSLPEDELRGVIRSSTSGLLRFRPVNLERIEADAQRLRSYFRRSGYWDVEVTERILFDRERKRTRAIFHIEEGVLRLLGEARVEGNVTFSTEEILSWTELRRGDPLGLPQVDRDRTKIEDTYANRGFYAVQVSADIQPSDNVGSPVLHDLVYRIDEGKRFIVGEIHIRGNDFTHERIIRRELTIHENEFLTRDRVTESRSRLYATGYFSRVEILPRAPEAAEGSVDVLVHVRERQMRFVGLGVGYGTRDQLRLTGEWGHRNLWGRGKRASVRGLLATELFPTDLVRRRLETRYVEPWLFGTRTIGSVDLYLEKRREFFRDQDTQERLDYKLDLKSVILNVNRNLKRSTRGWVSLQNEWADIDADPGVEPPDDSRPDITRSVTLTLERDRRDDFFDPHRGFLHRLIGSVSGGLLGGDNDFWKTSFEMSWYRPLGGVVVAGRVRVGYEEPYGQSDRVPDRLRFKLGGANTVRGYREQDIGPGDFALLGNAEVRVPLFWILRLGFFLDAGNAWQKSEDVTWRDFNPVDAKDDPAAAADSDVRYSAGVGLRCETPVGPVRLDFGRKLKILPVQPGGAEERRWRFHFSLGQVF